MADKALDFLGVCDVLVNNQEAVMGVDFDWADKTKVVPVGFCAENKDIAELTIFLASEESQYILGQTLVADTASSRLWLCHGIFVKPGRSSGAKRYV